MINKNTGKDKKDTIYNVSKIINRITFVHLFLRKNTRSNVIRRYREESGIPPYDIHNSTLLTTLPFNGLHS